jgi:hypothetical protein
LEEFGGHPYFYCGHDLHGVDGIAPLALEVETETLASEAIIAQLRRGAFNLHGPAGHFSSEQGPNRWQRIYLYVMRAVYKSYSLSGRVPLVGAALRKGRNAGRSVDPLDE